MVEEPVEVTPEAETLALSGRTIVVADDVVPDDPASPFVTSGIRIGTPAVTSRGMKSDEMRLIADLIVTALRHPSNDGMLDHVKQQVRDLCNAFPIYPDI